MSCKRVTSHIVALLHVKSQQHPATIILFLLTSSQHKLGVAASEADAAPEFHAQVLPAGTAPTDKTHTPNPDLNNQKMYTNAAETITGSTSKDVHKNIGSGGDGEGGGGLVGLAQGHSQGNAKDALEPPTKGADIKSAEDREPVSADQS